MLLAPEFDQRLRKTRALPKPAMDPGVAGGAERNQKFFAMNAGQPVMDGQAETVRLPCPTALTAVAIAGEDSIAVAVKVAPGMGVGPIAPQAESGDRGDCFAAGAKEDFLPGLRKPAAERNSTGGTGPGSLQLRGEGDHNRSLA